MTIQWRAVALVALLGAPAAACSDDGPGPGEARLEVDGQATVERADGDRETIDGGTDLAGGDRVSMDEGVAVMRLQGGTTYELRKGFGTAADTTVLMADRPVLEAGDLLVTTPESAQLEADGTEVDVSEGAARVTRAFGMSVAAYDADIDIDSAGVLADVPALRQMVVPDLGRPPGSWRPIEPDLADPWDRRYLGAAMALGTDLEAMGDQLTGFLRDDEGRSFGSFKLLLPGLEDEDGFDQHLLDALDRERVREQGDILIGAAIADLGEGGSFTERWDDVFGFRDEGAAWGIVALDQSVRSRPLVGNVEEAFNTSFAEVALAPDPGGSGDPAGGGRDGGSTGGAESGGAPTGGGGVDGTGGTDSTDGGSTPTTPPSTPPVTVPPIIPPITPPSTPDPPPVLDPLIDPVTDLLEDLVGGLLG